MVFILPKADTFSEQLAKQLAGSASQGIANTPNMLMDLLKQKREREFKYGEKAAELAQQAATAKGDQFGLEDYGTAFSQGAELGGSNASPTEATKEILKRQVKEQDKLRRIKESAEPEGFFSSTKRFFSGQTKADSKANKERLRKKLAESGWSDRKKWEVLSKEGWYPEDISDLTNKLPEETASMVDTFPDLIKRGKLFPKATPLFESAKLTEPQRKFFQDSLAEIYASNPNADPLALRLKFENKGVNWREFRDAINKLQEEGVVDFSNNESYPLIEEYINKPPLAPLEKALHKMKIVGR